MKIITLRTKFGALKSLAVAGFVGACSIEVSEGALFIHELNYQAGITGTLIIDDAVFDEDTSKGFTALGGSGMTVTITTTGTSTDGTFADFSAYSWEFSGSPDIDLSIDLVPQLTDLNFHNSPSGWGGVNNSTLGNFNFFPVGPEYVLLSTSVAAVPEPSSTALLGLGGLALMLRRRR
jgi:hypothetical protein